MSTLFLLLSRKCGGDDLVKKENGDEGRWAWRPTARAGGSSCLRAGGRIVVSSRETTVSTGLALAMTDDAANPSAMGIIKEWEPRREPSVWCLFQTSGEKPTARREDRRVFAGGRIVRATSPATLARRSPRSNQRRRDRTFLTSILTCSPQLMYY